MKLTPCSPSSCSPFTTNRLSLFPGFLRNSFPGFPALDGLFNFPAFQEPGTQLAVDLYEDADHLYARFEVPGVKKEDLKLELDDGRLSVAFEKREKTAQGERTLRLQRSVTVPDTVDAAKISAKLEDGVLTLTLPKQEARKPRTIEIL